MIVVAFLTACDLENFRHVTGGFTVEASAMELGARFTVWVSTGDVLPLKSVPPP